MDNLSSLTAISPIDGRYRSKTAELAPFFSEFGLIKYRVWVEIEYFIALCEIPLLGTENFNPDNFSLLRKIYQDFSLENAEKIKTIERTTNHDVKAVEYFIKEEFDKLGLSEFKEFVHFGLTSQDINNTAIPMLLRDALNEVILPNLTAVKNAIAQKAEMWKNVPLLAHTHGQPASPTRLGKEIAVFVYRIEEQIKNANLIHAAKFGGATGNFNAHFVAFPNINWVEFGNHFLENKLGLSRSLLTTQIENYDHLAACLDFFKRVNTILIDFSRDIWAYVSMNYFKQKIKANEVGSSAMPHKVNPIDFENAEGNMMTANAIYEFLASKLPISRLQRDLTDSTVLRNIGTPFAHSLIAFSSLLKGLDRIELNEAKILADLEDNWVVVAEAYQTILRRENYPNPYEALKALSRTNKKLDKQDFWAFVETLAVSDAIKAELKAITPFNYTGVFADFSIQD